ncbi:MAG: hypothetical protein ABJD11_01390 [Gemmatimonadota bacterium]
MPRPNPVRPLRVFPRPLSGPVPAWRPRPALLPALVIGTELLLLAAAPRLVLRVIAGLPQRAIDALYFLPQYVFPFGHLYRILSAPSPAAHPLDHRYGWIFWAVAVLGFAHATRRIRGWRLPFAAAGAIMLLTGAIHLSLRPLGYRFYLDGPGGHDHLTFAPTGAPAGAPAEIIRRLPGTSTLAPRRQTSA